MGIHQCTVVLGVYWIIIIRVCRNNYMYPCNLILTHCSYSNTFGTEMAQWAWLNNDYWRLWCRIWRIFFKYRSLVGTAERFYLLTGRRDPDGNTIGWTVNWQNADLNAHAVTTWSGQLQKSPLGDPVILTTWLLTAQKEPRNDWDSTNVGKDEFFTQQPSQESIERALFRCQRSHPKTAWGWIHSTVRLGS